MQTTIGAPNHIGAILLQTKCTCTLMVDLDFEKLLLGEKKNFNMLLTAVNLNLHLQCPGWKIVSTFSGTNLGRGLLYCLQWV